MLARTAVRASNRGVTRSSYRMISSSIPRFAEDGKKKDEYKSILNDDLLSQAGVDVDAGPLKAGEALKEESGSELNEELKKKFELQRAQQKKRKHTTQSDIKRERYANLFYLGGAISFLGASAYMAREWDPEEDAELYNKEENGYSPANIYTRVSKRFKSVFNLFTEPAFNDLLPPPPPEPYKRPLTLVLTLDDLLIHSDWTAQKGWKTAKRPGLDYFLGYLSQYYEIVIFSSNYMQFGEAIIQKLDPFHAFISYSLFREAARYVDGKVVKDLSLMNRDLSKMIIVDVNPDSYALQPKNAIPMEPWDGKPDDRLIKLIPFLEYLATQPLKDVRPILDSFLDKTKIPEEFLERENLLRQKFEEDFKAKQALNPGSNWAASLLGLPASQQRTPKMPLDLIREEGQKQYLAFQNYLKEHGEKILAEEKQREKEFLAENKFTLEKILVEGMPTAEEVAKKQAAKAESSASN